MNVVPSGYGNGGDMFGLGGANGAWWLIILLLFFNNGWGGNRGNGTPVIIQDGNGTDGAVRRGFDQAAIMGAINGLAQGQANAEISRCNMQANVLGVLNANHSATLQGMNTLAMGLQNCCCENRAGLADLKYTVATENCADRTTFNEGIRDVLVASGNNTQRLIDVFGAKIDGVMGKICQLELDAKNDKIAELQAALNDANRRAESKDEIAQIMAGQRALASEVEQYVLPTPRPAWIVQNPNCCQPQTACGCAA
jgi:hypothetical protein